MVFATDPTHETISPVGDFVTFPAAKRAADRDIVPHEPARSHGHDQPAHQHGHQRGNVMTFKPAPDQAGEAAENPEREDGAEKAENEVT